MNISIDNLTEILYNSNVADVILQLKQTSKYIRDVVLQLMKEHGIMIYMKKTRHKFKKPYKYTSGVKNINRYLTYIDCVFGDDIPPIVLLKKEENRKKKRIQLYVLF